MKCRCQVLQFFVFTIAAACTRVQKGSGTLPRGILDKIIIEILESLRPQLADLRTEFQAFETGDQEFGNFRGHFETVAVEGLDKFRIEILKTSLLDVNNLTIVEEKIKANGFYKINGSLAFPLGKNDIHLFGDGPFRAEISNFSISLKIKLRNVNGINLVKDLDIIVQVDKMNLYLENLMGGGELEKVFNQLMNDVGLTVFDYYKEPILEAVKPQIKEFINQMLNRNEDTDNVFLR